MIVIQEEKSRKISEKYQKIKFKSEIKSLAWLLSILDEFLYKYKKKTIKATIYFCKKKKFYEIYLAFGFF
jgi:hypothetical protein